MVSSELQTDAEVVSPGGPDRWPAALLFALGIDTLVIALYIYWFAFADRYRIFLYHHDMGPNVPDTAPFSQVTSSRYWMTGLVASGSVMLLYLALNWLFPHLSSRYRAPSWWRVWLPASLPLVVAIPVITMLANEPGLTVPLAARTTLICLAALALALSPGRMAAERPAELLWLALDGMGLMFLMVTLPGIQFFERWLEQGLRLYVIMFFAGCLLSLLWLLVLSLLGTWRRRPVPPAATLLVAGFALSYLIVPLLHHLVFTDGYYYITDSDNFLARNPVLQLIIWLIALVLSWAVSGLRRRLRSRYGEVQPAG